MAKKLKDAEITAEEQKPGLDEKTTEAIADILAKAYAYISETYEANPRDVRSFTRYAEGHLLAFIVYLGGNGADSTNIVIKAQQLLMARNKEKAKEANDQNG